MDFPGLLVLQSLTGFEGIRAKLHDLGKDIDSLYPICRIPSTAILDCIAFEALRAKQLRETGLYVLAENEFPQLASEQNHPKTLCMGGKLK